MSAHEINPCVLDVQIITLESLLPLQTIQTLRNIRDLTVSCKRPIDDPEWPTAWTSLTNMTRLALLCKGFESIRAYSNSKYYMPEFLQSMENLEEISLRADYDTIVSSRQQGSGVSTLTGMEGYLLALEVCLPLLRSVQILLADCKEAGELTHDEIGKVESLCQAATFSGRR